MSRAAISTHCEHSFTTALEDAGVLRQFIDELTGHEGTGETSRYAKGAIAQGARPKAVIPIGLRVLTPAT